MRSHASFLIFIATIVLVSVGFTQAGVSAPSGPADPVPSEPNVSDTPSYPYDALITGDRVKIRSGPGTNFYHCGFLNKGDRVTVVSRQFSWSRIVPPAGTFSWISEQYIKIDPANPGFGLVTGNSVRVYAGSDYQKAMYSTTRQGMLDKDEKVKLLGEQADGYYKIGPPSFAYLWVSTEYTKAVPRLVQSSTPSATVEPLPQGPNDTNAVTVNAVVPSPTIEPAPKSHLAKYRDLQKQVEAERTKPLDQQDYTEMKKALNEIANDKEAGRVVRYAQFVLQRIERYELALAVSKQVKLQNEQLQKTATGIEKARDARLAQVQDVGRFAVTGVLQPYATFGPGHYRIVDDSGKMVCYALPSGAIVQMDLKRLVGKKVGLVGTIEPHRATKKALVRFTQIVVLEQLIF
jgi:uncharacterized protein YgiM (DUF1202 family)